MSALRHLADLDNLPNVRFPKADIRLGLTKLEYEVGVQLMIRSVHGIELTAAGRAFLDNARLALTQAEAAAEAARRAAQPPRTLFAIGFLTGYEMDWLPAVMEILRAELPSTEVVIHSQDSPDLATGLISGKIDLAFVRKNGRPV
jgi:LysR family hca operon transcriptional activator